MNIEITDTNLQFLSGGGEMGKLMRSKDWSRTSIGTPDAWPPSLRATLSILLNSRFPMFLWWGPELICFYNDAYRPSLGQQGKHPSILGMKAEQAWTEIWPMIKPLIDQVLKGESVWFENQLVPIFRNGKIEDVYWTFSYSPIKNEEDSIEGVFVVCTETTGAVNAFKSLEESNRRYYNNIIQAPVAMCIFRGKNHVVEIANPLMLELWGKTEAQVMNKPIFEGLPEAKGQGLEELVDNVFKTGERFMAIERPVNLPRNGKIETTYINFVYEALREPDGTIIGIASTATEVTSQVIARKKIEDAEERLRLATEAGGVATFDLDLLTNEIIYSESLSEIFDLDKGKKYDHAALRNRIHPEDMNNVKRAFEVAMQTGVIEYEARVLKRDGSIAWVRTQGKIFLGEAKKPIKLIGTIRNITEERLSQMEVLESEKNLRRMIHQAPVSICILRGPDYMIEIANDRALQLWGRTWKQVMNKPILMAMPELLSQGIKEFLDNVYTTGNPFWTSELPVQILRNETLETVYISFSFEPIYKTDGTINGIMAVGFEVTDQVVARKKIEENEERLNVVIDASELGTWELNFKTDAVSYSSRYIEVFGYGKDAVLSHQQLISHLHPDSLKNREEALTRAYRTGILEYESKVIWPDNSIHWMQAKGKIFYDEENKPEKLIGTIRDITEEKNFAHELERQVMERTRELEYKNRELEKMNIELQSFAYVSSHDLQEPLRKIQTFADRILETENKNLSGTGKDYFLRMQKAAGRMQTLINDLLAYSRTNTTERIFSNIKLKDIWPT